MILASTLGDWTDDLHSALSTVTSAVQSTCAIAQSSAASTVAAGASQVLPSSANDVLNKINGYAQQTCAVASGSGSAAAASPASRIMTFKLSPAQAAAIAANSAAARTYPTGTITTFDPAKQLWRVGVPRGLAGLGAAYVEVQSASSKPSGASEVPVKDFNKAVGAGWHRTWWGMTAIGVGAALATVTVGYHAVIKPSRR
jgi:hypothetical protein